MYSKEEQRKIRRDFWTAFGLFMKKHDSVTGLPVNWINYKTRVQNIRFTTDADKKSAWFSIDLTHPSKELRDINFEQMVELKSVLNSEFGDELLWYKTFTLPEGKEISRIGIHKEGLAFNDRNNWKELFEFFEKGLLGMDSFWSDFSFLFKELEQLNHG